MNLESKRRSATACVRCRQKKKRCDQRLPKCRSCELAEVQCLGYDKIAGRQVPRSYTHSLEDKVAFLEAKLREHGIDLQEYEQVQTSASQELSEVFSASDVQNSRASHENESDNTSDASSAVREFLSLTRGKPTQEPSFSKLLLTELVKSTMVTLPSSFSRDADSQTISSGIIGDLDTGPLCLPAEAAAKRLVKVYFEVASMGMPLLHEPTFEHKLHYLYQLPRTIDIMDTHSSLQSRIAVFFVLEVFAVALLAMHKQEPSRVPIWVADRYHRTAVKSLKRAGLPIGVEGVQALVLLGQYSYFHPTLCVSWRIVGIAFRFAVEMGFHNDSLKDEVDCLALDTMRRAFWVAYSMDRNISMMLSMPIAISDGVVSAQFPSNVQDKYITPDGIMDNAQVSSAKCVSFHLFRYRQLQSEIHTVLYERPSPKFTFLNFDKWQNDICKRIKAWFNSYMPMQSGSTEEDKSTVEKFEVSYHTALFYLYRPSLNIPSPSDSQLLEMANAARNMIQLYRLYFKRRILTIYWQAVENVSSAGIGLMFGYAQSSLVRAQITFNVLEDLIHACSTVLWGMVEHFPAFRGKRDAFDMAASKALADLNCQSSFGVDREHSTPLATRPWSNEADWAVSSSSSAMPTMTHPPRARHDDDHQHQIEPFPLPEFDTDLSFIFDTPM